MEVVLDGKECTTYPDTYLKLINSLSETIGLEDVPRLTIDEFLTENSVAIKENDIKIVFLHHEELKNNLGYKETENFYKELLKVTQFDKISSIILFYKNAQKCVGDTMYDRIVEVLKEHNIDIILK